MSPELPDVPDFDMPLPGDVDPERAKYEALLRESEERKASLEAVRLSVAMLKEKQDAITAAFREELRAAHRARLQAEMTLDTREQAMLALVKVTGEQHRAEVRKWSGRLHEMYRALHALSEAVKRAGALPAVALCSTELVNALREGDEALATAAEYLD